MTVDSSVCLSIIISCARVHGQTLTYSSFSQQSCAEPRIAAILETSKEVPSGAIGLSFRQYVVHKAFFHAVSLKWLPSCGRMQQPLRGRGQGARVPAHFLRYCKGAATVHASTCRQYYSMHFRAGTPSVRWQYSWCWSLSTQSWLDSEVILPLLPASPCTSRLPCASS